MTKKQFKELSQYAESLAQSKAGYYRALLRQDAEKLAQIYEELGYEAGKLNCNRCILAMLLNLAKEYDKYLEKQQTKENKINKENNDA